MSEHRDIGGVTAGAKAWRQEMTMQVWRKAHNFLSLECVREEENEVRGRPQSSRWLLQSHSREYQDHKLCFRKFKLEAYPG